MGYRHGRESVHRSGYLRLLFGCGASQRVGRRMQGPVTVLRRRDTSLQAGFRILPKGSQASRPQPLSRRCVADSYGEFRRHLLGEPGLGRHVRTRDSPCVASGVTQRKHYLAGRRLDRATVSRPANRGARRAPKDSARDWPVNACTGSGGDRGCCPGRAHDVHGSGYELPGPAHRVPRTCPQVGAAEASAGDERAHRRHCPGSHWWGPGPSCRYCYWVDPRRRSDADAVRPLLSGNPRQRDRCRNGRDDRPDRKSQGWRTDALSGQCWRVGTGVVVTACLTVVEQVPTAACRSGRGRARRLACQCERMR